MNNDIKFGLIATKDRFLEKLNNSEIEESWIIFIQDTCEIWTNGSYYGAVDLETYNGLDQETPGMALDAVQGRVLDEKIMTLKDIFEKEVLVPGAERALHVVISQEEYNQRLEEGTLSDDIFYYIPEE